MSSAPLFCRCVSTDLGVCLLTLSMASRWSSVLVPPLCACSPFSRAISCSLCAFSPARWSIVFLYSFSVSQSVFPVRSSPSSLFPPYAPSLSAVFVEYVLRFLFLRILPISLSRPPNSFLRHLLFVSRFWFCSESLLASFPFPYVAEISISPVSPWCSLGLPCLWNLSELRTSGLIVLSPLCLRLVILPAIQDRDFLLAASGFSFIVLAFSFFCDILGIILFRTAAAEWRVFSAAFRVFCCVASSDLSCAFASSSSGPECSSWYRYSASGPFASSFLPLAYISASMGTVPRGPVSTAFQATALIAQVLGRCVLCYHSLRDLSLLRRFPVYWLSFFIPGRSGAPRYLANFYIYIFNAGWVLIPKRYFRAGWIPGGFPWRLIFCSWFQACAFPHGSFCSAGHFMAFCLGRVSLGYFVFCYVLGGVASIGLVWKRSGFVNAVIYECLIPGCCILGRFFRLVFF